MSWWELFRRVTTNEDSKHIVHNRELIATESSKSQSSFHKHTDPTWAENRDYIAARRYWNRASTDT